MATYYRWEKYNWDYVSSESLDKNNPAVYLTRSPNGFWYSTTKPSVGARGTLHEGEMHFPNFIEFSYEGQAVDVSKDWYISNKEYNSEYAYTNIVVVTDSGSDIKGTTSDGIYRLCKPVKAISGSILGYVYSTNPGAYPFPGISGDYYYYNRTTVTSPTAPSGLSYPATITTPSVDVTWTAATSNVPDYPVNGYQVDVSTNGGSSWTLAGTPTTNSLTYPITPGVTSIMFRVRAKDSNGQWGSYVTGTASQVLLAPTLTVPQMLMQGQQATIKWSAIEGASSYTLQRKSSADTDWMQVYSGANLTFSEAVGTWTTVQYRVQAVFDGTPGGWAESAVIPVVSASSLVISGTDEDLGVVTNDIPYSISTDTGNQIAATITVNNAVIFSGNVGNSTADVIPVLDLITGEGTIVISATVEASGGPVTATRTWTYEKAAITFPNSGSVAQVTKEGENIYPKVLAEGVRLPGGKTLDQVMGFPCQIYTGTKYGINNNTELEFPFNPKALLVFSGITLGLFIRGSNTGYCTISSNSYEDSTLEWKENSIRFVDSPFAANQTYTYVCFG